MNQQKKDQTSISIKTEAQYVTEKQEIHIKLEFDTDYDKKIFEGILSLLTGASLDSFNIDKATPISLSPNKLKDIIQYWHPTKDNLNKMEVVEDIIGKVKMHNIGTYYYECRRSKYKLEIGEKGSYFYDLIRDRQFRFVK